MKRLVKIFLYSLLSLLILAGATAYILRNYLQEIILHRLQTEIETTFNQYYHLKYASIQTSIVDGGFGIKIIQPVFSTDTSQKFYLAKYPAIYFKADSIEIGQINIERLFTSESIKFDFVSLSNPELVVFISKHPKQQTEQQEVKASRKVINEIVFSELLIQKGNISILPIADPSDTLYYGENINMTVTHTRIPTQAEEGIYAASKIENILFSMSNVRFYPEKSPYAFLMKEVRFNAEQNTVICGQVNVLPEKSLLKMSKNSAFQKTFAEMFIGNISLKGINYDKIGEPAFDVQRVEIANSHFFLLRNKNKLLNKSLYKKSIQEALLSVKLPLNIDTLKLRNLHLTVTLHFPKHTAPATIELHHINGTVLHVTNDVTTNRAMVLHANATVMKTGKLVFDASFPVNKQTHTYQAHITNMPFSEWNQVISRLASVELTSGNIRHISLKGKATAMETSGNIVFEYSDLQATVFKKTKTGELKKAKGLTHLANGFLRLHNPDKGETIPVNKQYYFKREPWQGPIMLWIGGLLDGIEATLLNEHLKRRVDEAEAENVKKRKK